MVRSASSVVFFEMLAAQSSIGACTGGGAGVSMAASKVDAAGAAAAGAATGATMATAGAATTATGAATAATGEAAT